MKHAVAFEEAVTVFDDPLSTTVVDPDHSLREERLVIFGKTSRGRVLAVMHTERGTRIRVFSAREATRSEAVNAALRPLLEIARRQLHRQAPAA